jgi:hypothetical protein
LYRSVLHDPDSQFNLPLLQLLNGIAMRKNVLIFIGLALLALSVVPAINLSLETAKKNRKTIGGVNLFCTTSISCTHF